MAERFDLEIDSSPSVFFHRNNPAVPDEKCAELTEDGIGIVDWGMGLSWDPTEAEESRQDNARKALETILSLNQNGGYGVIHTPKYEEVVVGRAEPPCIQFLELETTGGEIQVFKGFQLDSYASIEVRDDYPELHNRLVDRASHGTTVSIKDEYKHLVTDAFADVNFDTIDH